MSQNVFLAQEISKQINDLGKSVASLNETLAGVAVEINKAAGKLGEVSSGVESGISVQKSVAESNDRQFRDMRKLTVAMVIVSAISAVASLASVVSVWLERSPN